VAWFSQHIWQLTERAKQIDSFLKDQFICQYVFLVCYMGDWEKYS